MSKVCLPSNDGLLIFDQADIYYIVSDDIYSQLHTESNKYYIKLRLKELYLMMDHKIFYRLHRSFIINVDKIARINYSPRAFITLDNDKEIPIARQKKTAFKEFIIARFRH